MKKKYSIISIILVGLLTFSGCGTQTLENKYTFSNFISINSNNSSLNSSINTFSSNLAVISENENNPNYETKATSLLLINDTDSTIKFSYNPFQRIYPASITKIMTAYLTLKYTELDEKVTIKRNMKLESGAVTCYLREGDVITINELLHALMIYSANDAGEALADYISGSVKKFAKLMNDEARALGATGTHFVNPHGLHDDNHYTTAYDLYLIFKECIKYPAFVELISTKEYNLKYYDEKGMAKTLKLINSNQYLQGTQKMPKGVSVIGGKTGTTSIAGCCLILYSKDSKNKDYISVVIKAPTKNDLYNEMTNLLEME